VGDEAKSLLIVEPLHPPHVRRGTLRCTRRNRTLDRHARGRAGDGAGGSAVDAGHGYLPFAWGWRPLPAMYVADGENGGGRRSVSRRQIGTSWRPTTAPRTNPASSVAPPVQAGDSGYHPRPISSKSK